MPNYIEIPDNDIRFVADTHFRSPAVPGEPERRDRFIRFLRSLPDGCVLFMLGDIFDFYFEYRSVVAKRFFDLFAALLDCRRRGVKLHFIGGNHDYWVGDFITGDLGIRLHENEVLIAAQGRKVVCAHGDLVMPRDTGYKILKTVIRNRAVIAVSRWIHPDIMDAIARGVATGSRTISKAPQDVRAHEMADVAHRDFFSRDNDIFVMGHVHYPLLDVRDGREFLLVGDWIENFTYGKLCDGKLSLIRFTDEDPG
ncbi:MAG: UDP-2,3-diacylglucosamine diphosphatase [Candidatus Latescibacterota bacterium]|jgi:UDP-2,3-diacylglucosamine hydrolase